MKQEEWERLSPEGYLTTWTTRHMSKNHFQRIKILGAMNGWGNELAVFKLLEAGLQVYESELPELAARIYTREET